MYCTLKLAFLFEERAVGTTDWGELSFHDFVDQGGQVRALQHMKHTVLVSINPNFNWVPILFKFYPDKDLNLNIGIGKVN
jgi:hypothetical protein